MFWRSKSKPKQEQESLISFLDKYKDEAPKPSPEKNLSEALNEYQTQYYEKVSRALDKDAEEAKRIVREAKEFITNSRIAYSICRPVFEHVQYWPSWSTHDDFTKYCAPPFRYISGSNSNEPKTTVVTFSYDSKPFTLTFVDEGMATWATDDMNTYGKLEFRSGDSLVLGIEVKKDLSKEFGHWWLTDVFAFVPGPWMKDLVEMAAYIDGKSTREREEFHNNLALERAKNIKLPD
jgi:hypothetical protein